MTNTEIKKALYKEKPTATAWHKNDTDYFYDTYFGEGKHIYFRVPISDMGATLFDNEIPAQLLIRWII